jgi:type I restriction enzyme S subunit
MTWPTKKLGEVCEKLKIEKAPVGTTPYIEIGDIEVGTKTVNYKEKGAVKGSIFCPSDCVIVSRVRPTRGAAALLDQRVTISSAFTILKPRQIVDLKFLFFYLAHNPDFFDYLGTKQKGSSYPSCRESDILDFEIPLPPIEEQRRIVKKIEELFAKIDEAQKLREESKKDASALLQSALNKIFSGPKSKKWEEKTIEDLCIVQSGGTPSKAIASYWEDGNISWLRSESCKDEKISSAKLYITQKGLENSSAKILKPRTTLIALVGATIGKTGFLNFKSTTNQNIAGLYPKNEKELFPEFLFICAKNLYPHFLNIGKGKFKMANLSFVKSLKIPLPSLAEQKKIVVYLDSLSEKVRELQKFQDETGKNLVDLKQSILQKSFSGELVK